MPVARPSCVCVVSLDARGRWTAECRGPGLRARLRALLGRASADRRADSALVGSAALMLAHTIAGGLRNAAIPFIGLRLLLRELPAEAAALGAPTPLTAQVVIETEVAAETLRRELEGPLRDAARDRAQVVGVSVTDVAFLARSSLQLPMH